MAEKNSNRILIKGSVVKLAGEHKGKYSFELVLDVPTVSGDRVQQVIVPPGFHICDSQNEAKEYYGESVKELTSMLHETIQKHSQ